MALLLLASAARGISAQSLIEIDSFGADPGRLRMFIRVPRNAEALAGPRPLLVLLHGCGQDAHDLLRLTAWDRIADSTGCYLLLPQQRGANNPMRCFNWFRADDVVPEKGEVASIARMIDHARATLPVDTLPVRVFGVSAGAAMAVALAAAYPQCVAQVAAVAGAPYGAIAKDEAGRRPAFRPDALSPEARADRVRAASEGPVERYPRLVVMHGTADAVVDFDLARALVAQWTALAGTDSIPDREERLEARHAVLRQGHLDASGHEVVVLYAIEGLGHRLAQDADGRRAWPGKGIGFSAVLAIAREFGLLD